MSSLNKIEVDGTEYDIADAGAVRFDVLQIELTSQQRNRARDNIYAASFFDVQLKVDKTTTVNGHALSGNVTVTKSDVGLSNVNNTSDANKPVSTAQQAALDLKVDKTSIYNGLDKTASGYTLDARQGKALKDTITLDEKYDKLLHENVPNTTQTITFDSSGNVSTIVHTNGNNVAVRTDAFTFGIGTITEVRTLNTGESLTIITNTTTLTTTVTYAA